MDLSGLTFLAFTILTLSALGPVATKALKKSPFSMVWKTMNDMTQISQAYTRKDFVAVLIKAIDLRFDLSEEEVDFLTRTILNALKKVLNWVHPMYNTMFPKTSENYKGKHATDLRKKNNHKQTFKFGGNMTRSSRKKGPFKDIAKLFF